MEITTKSAKETSEFGEKVAADLKVKGTVVFALTGDLGSGKTTFVKGLAKGLGVSPRILSPTFILMREYDLNVKGQMSKVKCFYHIDLYRLESDIEKELKNLGVDDLWSNKENIIAIEWAEKAKDFIPKNAIWITFENIGKGKRKIRVASNLQK